MALIPRAAKYSDLFEWQLYNAAAVGMGLTGENYLYNNPLACRGGITRKAWYAVPCCPSNLSLTWADLGIYIYSTDQNAVWIHQYIGSQTKLNPGGAVEITLRRTHPRVKRHQNKADLTRGPLVYCLESVDNPGVDIFSARLEPTTLHAEYAADLLGGITLLSGQTTDGASLTFIPYHLWANRGESQMMVWVNV